MAKYVNGFVLVVPRDKAEAYKTMALMGRDSWMKHGAVGYFECRGDELKPQEMGDQKSWSFPDMAKAGPDEEVWFSFIIFESKAHRDKVNAAVMAEMHEQMKGHENDPMPMDMQRMAYGGFQVEVEG